MDATDSLNSTASTILTPRRNVAGSRGGKENCEPRGSLSSGICWDGIGRIPDILKTERAAESDLLITGVQSPSTERYHSGETSSSSSGHEPSWKHKLCLLERELVQSRRTIRSLAKEVNRRQTKGSTSTLSWHTVSASSGPREEAEVCTFEDSRGSFANPNEGEKAETKTVLSNRERDNVPPADTAVCQLLRQLLAALSLVQPSQALHGDLKREQQEAEDKSELGGCTDNGEHCASSGAGASSGHDCSPEEQWERLVKEAVAGVPGDEEGLIHAVRVVTGNCREYLCLQDRVPEREMGLSVERDLGESRPRNAGRVAEEVAKQVKAETEVYICERKQLIRDQVTELEGVKAAFKSRDDHILCLTERVKELETSEVKEQEVAVKRKRPKEVGGGRDGGQPPLQHSSSQYGLEQWVGLLTPPPLAAVHEILQNITSGEEKRVLVDALKERTREVLQMETAIEQLEAKCRRLQLHSERQWESEKKHQILMLEKDMGVCRRYEAEDGNRGSTKLERYLLLIHRH